MELVCPQCSSGDVRAFAVVSASGTSRVLMSGDAFGMATSTTALAQSTAPPKRKGPLVSWLAGIATTVVFWLVLTATAPPITRETIRAAANRGMVVLYSSIAAGVVVGVLLQRQRARWNVREYPALLSRWQSSFLCMRCGATFRR